MLQLMLLTICFLQLLLYYFPMVYRYFNMLASGTLVLVCASQPRSWPVPCSVYCNERTWSLQMLSVAQTRIAVGTSPLSPVTLRGTKARRDLKWVNIFQAINQPLSKCTFFECCLFYFNLPSVRRIQITICSRDLGGYISHIVSKKLEEKTPHFECGTAPARKPAPLCEPIRATAGLLSAQGSVAGRLRDQCPYHL